MEDLEKRLKGLHLEMKSLCCNSSNQSSPCNQVASFACEGCHMVSYCSEDCQKQHWEIHRNDCESPLLKGTWQPRWMIEKRYPTLREQAPLPGEPKQFWGDMPAFDVIQLNRNEGPEFEGPISMLFAASGDLGNVVLSVSNLPSTYQGCLNITMNDVEFDIVARNAIFLLTMFVEKDPVAAVECMIHTWYSAFLPESCYSLLKDKVRPLVVDVYEKIKHRPEQILQAKTWTFGESSLRLVLTGAEWQRLIWFLESVDGFKKQEAQTVRTTAIMPPSRADINDREITWQPPEKALGMMKFRHDGILLPFGSSREPFFIPNPYGQFARPFTWPITAKLADPTNGWATEAFLSMKSVPASKDIYGQLYYYLKRLFAVFHAQLQSKASSFTLLNVSVMDLPKKLAGKRFDRVDVSNVGDVLGFQPTLRTFGSLLQPQLANPHATLVMLFTAAVLKMKGKAPDVVGMHAGIKRIGKYMPEMDLKGMGRQLSRPDVDRGDIAAAPSWKLIRALEILGDVDSSFNLCMQELNFDQVASAAGLEMKARHTIVHQWPLREPIGLGSVTSDSPTEQHLEQFKYLMGSNHTGSERYVEWKRASEAPTTS
ncbi:hypothetical protein GGR57DRAFT_490006 [Xylariaceae sp. FL1272]|nr:hypothetical protein GGR57DRAFT_490006 [Xylariaceae sp. FL1272]